MQKIIEGNKLIAEFMGLTQGKPNETRWKHDWFDEAGAVTGRRETHLLFHSDWNWLMTVVRKLEEVEFEPDNNINITIGPSNYCKAFPSHGDSFEFIGEESTTIACVYKVAVELVEMIREQGYAI